MEPLKDKILGLLIQLLPSYELISRTSKFPWKEINCSYVQSTSKGNTFCKNVLAPHEKIIP